MSRFTIHERYDEQISKLTARPALHGLGQGTLIAEIVVDNLLPAVMEWLSGAGGEEDSPEDVRKELLKMLDRSIETDGYHLAKHLDNQGWDADSALVDVMDSVSYLSRSAVSAVSERWLKAIGFTPLADGTLVQKKPGVSRAPSNLKDGVQYTIKSSYSDGRYALAEVGTTVTNGFPIVGFEFLEPVPTP